MLRMSSLFLRTLRDDPADAEVASHRLLVRAGYIRRAAPGGFTWLPLGWKVFQNVERVVREEMDRSGFQEVHFPALLPKEPYEATGRWADYGDNLFRLKDRRGNDFLLAPTHEEMFTLLVKDLYSSYKDLPVSIYQIQNKFRDEARPRAGLLRGREFVMKDAYSFGTSLEQLNVAYDAMYNAYCRIFERCGLKYLPVEAESGPIGGDASHEFMVPASNGEDFVIHCPACSYAANQERAETGRKSVLPTPVANAPAPALVPTPDAGSIEQVSKLLKSSPQAFIKTLIYKADGKPVAVLLRGDHTANEGKIRRAAKATSVELADEATILQVTTAPVGFAGPIGILCPCLIDHDVASINSAIVGANAKDAHLTGVIPGTHFPVTETFDLRNAEAEDPCPRCSDTLRMVHGIEVGHVFKLGTKYSVSMNACYVDAQEVSHPIIMGCYGIGVTRVVASIVETCHDENGIIWPLSVAPCSVMLIPLNVTDPEVMKVSERIYQELTDAGVDVLMDDRDQRPGFKFKDADLIGIPLRITIGGKGLAEGIAEVKWRGSAETVKPAIADTTAFVREQLAGKS